MANRHRHPINRRMVDDAPPGPRIADGVTSFMGSWAFITIQTVIVAIWILGNVYLVFRFDPYPFILLNLAFSTQAAYAAPLILLASNRAAARDRMTLEHAAAEADKEDRQNQQLLKGNREILAANAEILGRTEELLEHLRGVDRRLRSLESLERRVGHLDRPAERDASP